MDWERFYRNIYTLAKIQGHLIGDIEEQAGFSQGYLSKCKAGQYKDIGTGKSYTIAGILGVTVDDLIEKDFYTENRKEYLRKEIENMQKELEGLR